MKPFSVILLLRNVQVCLRECGPGESVAQERVWAGLYLQCFGIGVTVK